MLTPLVMVFGLSFLSLYLLRLLAFRIGLLDRPSERKHHAGAVPLVGGLSLYVCLMVYFLFYHHLDTVETIYILSISLLALVGALDDKFDVSYKVRFFIQIMLALLMISTVEVELSYLGNMFGFGEIHLGILSYPITLLAVIGAINAFNMVDGIDGLLGGLSIVTFSALGYLFGTSGATDLMLLCLIVIVALVPYIIMNLGLIGKTRKVFMGDAGSMLIGFTAVWLLIKATQPNFEPVMRPVTALWIIALPLMDMAAIMIRRVKRGDSPFKPDREHLHHICQRAGLNANQTLTAICTVALSMTGIGLIGENLQVPDLAMFGLFIIMFCAYYLALAHVWRLLTVIRRLVKKDKVFETEAKS
ncbi:undecaprenyl-phosphate alpha-N-acetylglucosaminyl 1-phosphate transferase [Enterovibrio norvegicus FF-33]|uniref:UDP-N-acetylglucosamine--undecaprenyl-phosphate N-acetylglucosaminephosphotransferase n=1 Tax=Enterovibrio norvegicus TaxID=188144 RepID=UPI0002D34F53|nr:UDP-N-acetylglucosamine--undecaprenyl-phosphate N-acetylglucosaminephosphotransferase [Enterovibrio norvegicus]OEE68068.1 undecaprenyl-phosphate alpha-N-acetylglucosaminyl 1-phosphate transferase [Enterovibrio norvegicus FF-33]OEE75033.1 undecaprenyl-phosphate alpha-N-acetylglucosaminyl 1-phosphate transferase [Enterovibrio norvegicus FF-162]